jgi:hypothetical protein
MNSADLMAIDVHPHAEVSCKTNATRLPKLGACAA